MKSGALWLSAPHESVWHSVQSGSPVTASGWILATLLVFAQAYRTHAINGIMIISKNLLFFILRSPFHDMLSIKQVGQLGESLYLVVEIRIF
jgi:hypothetical protein